jgi:2-amino-4-hydroxy-6-hydroxymethyldihydropteridine diphosphokinase
LRAYVSVGSNVEPATWIPEGLRRLERRLGTLRKSRFYRSPAMGEDGKPRPDPDFVNGVVRLETDLDRDRLVELLHAVEAECGRTRGADKFGPRTLDLDLIAYGDDVDEDALRNAWVAVPLRELAPRMPIPQPRGPPLVEVTL